MCHGFNLTKCTCWEMNPYILWMGISPWPFVTLLGSKGSALTAIYINLGINYNMLII